MIEEMAHPARFELTTSASESRGLSQASKRPRTAISRLALGILEVLDQTFAFVEAKAAYRHFDGRGMR